jgi:hypothetical protein
VPRPRSRVRYNITASPLQARLTPRAVPSVDPWTAGEMFVSPHVEERRRGLALLSGSDAARTSPLTLHLLATRVEEPDRGLRAQIVQALADYFEIRNHEYRYPAEVRGKVLAELRRWGQAQVLALLELHQPGAGTLISPETLRRLFERLPAGSGILTRLAGDRGLALPLRAAAIDMIGRVGYTDAGPVLEGLAGRLEGRRAGQMTMLFAPSDWPEDQALLPALKQTLRRLTEDQ